MRVKLKDIFDLQMGKTPSRSNLEYWNTTDYKWISIADLTKQVNIYLKRKNIFQRVLLRTVELKSFQLILW